MNNYKKNCTSIFENKCTGCGICYQICPCNAIIMKQDKEGFLKPIVNNELCINCQKCLYYCEKYFKQSKLKSNIIEVKACQTKDPLWLIESTAGGFFPTLAQWVIENNGVVFGTAWDDTMEPIICKASSIEEIRKFNGSKYVQSDIHHALSEIKEELKRGVMVLFSGTPCQNAAVKTFCYDINTENLITLDVICYGVPSPGLFKAYIKTIENKRNVKVVDFRFRDKHKYGWSHTTVIYTENKNGKVSKFIEKDYRKIPYYQMFSKRNCFRKSCYNCNYNTINRITDFTTGNFWGIENLTSSFNLYNGVSLVLINTEKAKIIYNTIISRISSIDMTIDQAILSNDALIRSTPYPSDRDQIYEYFINNGFMKMYEKYYKINYFKTIINNIKRKLKNIYKFAKLKNM